MCQLISNPVWRQDRPLGQRVLHPSLSVQCHVFLSCCNDSLLSVIKKSVTFCVWTLYWFLYKNVKTGLLWSKFFICVLTKLPEKTEKNTLYPILLSDCVFLLHEALSQPTPPSVSLDDLSCSFRSRGPLLTPSSSLSLFPFCPAICRDLRRQQWRLRQDM